MKRQKILNFYTNGSSQLAVVFPFIVGAPRYFSGAIQLGGLMQISNAFGQVQGSLSWFINAYSLFARWRAAVERLTGFHAAIEQARLMTASQDLQRETTAGTALSADHLDVSLPGGATLVQDAAFRIEQGDKVLLRGPSGSGKSTVFRTLAGIWPFATGRLHLPADFQPLFLPQRPYFPLGSLRQAVSYPAPVGQFGDDVIRAVLSDVGLEHLVARLDETGQWSQQLSGGEQQRMAFARALLLKPRWLFLDEATSNLDATAEERMYQLVHERLAQTTVVSIAHRPAVSGFHDRVLELHPRERRLVTAVGPG
jgi:putative ATP-binding cassette transporter